MEVEDPVLNETELAGNENAEMQKERLSPVLSPRRFNLQTDFNDEEFPPIPGTRRLGNRSNPRGSSISQTSILALNPSGLLMSPRIRKSNNTLEAKLWDAEAFRIKRREAQKAIEGLPQYIAAIRSGAVLGPNFEAVVEESISSRLQDDYEEAAFEMLKDLALKKLFFAWLAAARSKRKVREHLQLQKKLGRPSSFQAKFEMLVNQGPRIQPRVHRDTSSSVTTDLTRPSIADDFEGRAIPSTTEEEDHDESMKQLYNESTRCESVRISQKKLMVKKRSGNLLAALVRVVSFRAKS